MASMKRRHFVRALVAAPAAPAILAQQPAPQAPATSPQTSRPAEAAKLDTSIADDAAEPMPKFFAEPQLSALRTLSEMLTPGALKAGAPEFLDFLIGASPVERQKVYRDGLDALNAAATNKYGKPFAAVDASQAATLLAPLEAPWTYDEPADPLARFLRAAKTDVRAATMNAREFAAMASIGRRGGGIGLYWYPLD